MTKQFAILYHENCVDGFTAAWVSYRHFGDHADYIPAQYGRTPPFAALEGKEVFILDFSYKNSVLKEVGRVAKSVLVLDHHKSARDDLYEFAIPLPLGPRAYMRSLESAHTPGEPTIATHFDMQRSGAMLAWNFFFHEFPEPKIVQYVQDYDLWKHEMEDSREVNAYIRSFDFNFPVWDALAHYISASRSELVVPHGKTLLRQHMKNVREHVNGSLSKQLHVIDGFAVNVCNCPPAWASDAGNILAERKDQLFGATYYILASGDFKFSLRSNDTKEDVAAIAEKFGGGGHRNAAGFIVSQMFEAAPLPKITGKAKMAKGVIPEPTAPAQS